ncbi:MAG: hypothetical protein RMJ00_01055 [Nitrososphaerota archaeon]|nr:hypothetical protein [Candidatus Bathyarchaeota archaeon]MDW8061275.1 hypothetical protein [Nitrososphaerota archaeon]
MYVSKRNLRGSRCEAEPIGLAIAAVAIVLIAYVYWSIFGGFYESAILSLRSIEESLEIRYVYYLDEEVYVGGSRGIIVDGDLTYRLDLGAGGIHALELDLVARSLSGYTKAKLYIRDHRSSRWERLSEFIVDPYVKLYGPFRFHHASDYLYDGSIYIRFEVVGGSIYLDRIYALGYLRRSSIVRIGLYGASQYKPTIVSRVWLYDPYRVVSSDNRCIVPYGSIVDLDVDAESPYVYMVKIVTEDGRMYSAYLWRGLDGL